MANIKTELVEYSDDAGKYFEVFIARDISTDTPKPAVLIFPTWAGRSPAEDEKAKKLAALGYVGVSCDLYGKGISGASPEENAALMKPLTDDRTGLLLNRLKMAVEAVQNLPGVDGKKIAAMGYCFGGLCVLDMARFSNQGPLSSLVGVVSFHGILTSPAASPEHDIRTKILVLHGYNDPRVPPDQVVAFCAEMTKKKADWQLHMYGHAMHAFTNPNANDEKRGVKHDPNADRRSWEAMHNFFKELFA